MRVLFGKLTGFLLLLALVLSPQANAQEARLALVIGIANYKEAPLATAANDAGLVAQTLQAAGFDVTGVVDLDREALRHTLRDFVAKVQQAGPNAVVFVYLSGRGLQYAGENYFVPADAVVQREADVPLVTVRLTDFTRALAGLPAKARIFVLDGARSLHFATEGAPFASGFALVDAEPGSLYAFNAAPSSIAPDEAGPYGIYAQALVEMMRDGGSLDQVFIGTRLRANELSNGAIVPWDSSKIETPIFFFERDANAPPLPNLASQENQPLAGLPVSEAYWLVVERDTLSGYEDFLAAYPREPLSLRVSALLAARREALTWSRAVAANTPQAYWTYMRRYPQGPHFADARRRLSVLAAALDPPPRFDPYDFEGLPPPTEDEDEIIDQPVLIFNDPAFPRLPPLPTSILPLRPVEFEHLLPPGAGTPGHLPVPAPIPLPYLKPAAKPGAVAQPNVSQNQSGTPGTVSTSQIKPTKPLRVEKPAMTASKLQEKSSTSSHKPLAHEPKEPAKPKVSEKPKIKKAHGVLRSTKSEKPAAKHKKTKEVPKSPHKPAIKARKPAHATKAESKLKQHNSSKRHKAAK
jgi:uncharacterized caspase-like protein